MILQDSWQTFQLGDLTGISRNPKKSWQAILAGQGNQTPGTIATITAIIVFNMEIKFLEGFQNFRVETVHAYSVPAQLYQ